MRDLPPARADAPPPGQSLAQAVAVLCQAFAPAASLSLVLAQTRVAVVCDSPDTARAVGAAFRDFAAPPGPADITILLHCRPPVPEDFCPGVVLADRPFDPRDATSKEQWADLPGGRVVRKKRTGMVFVFGDNVHVAAGPCLDHLDQIVNFINFRMVARHLAQGCLLSHASGVARGERGILLAGVAGAGKSTLALRLVGRGLDFVSNDRLLVGPREPGPRMYGLAKMPRINPGTALADPNLVRVVPEADRAAFAALPTDRLWEVERKYDAVIDDLFGPGRFRLATDLFAVAVLTWRRGGGKTRVCPVDLSARPDLLGRIIKRPGIFLRCARNSVHDPETFARRLHGLPTFEFSGGIDFPAAEDALLALLDRPE
ncbi:HprK-related kinase B [Desulfovibrio sulfodismutans]|uniref:HprK-related kinase B n=1 Tax=Desulfolutivibrio sulfodismutans TaxID=63561 RepID=A0A7K3NIR3_9BACT|nr:HprK-related kinase B [Desulfolutivibrio sulfodismutans]NDY56078.1 HprK-related kinase B [Desulfolutivibrio sulfodismutans]